MPDEINFSTAAFLTSAPSLRECPLDSGAEVAFAGRSNAGKSSAINALTRQNKLARTSKTPGRTQLINFFALTEDQRLVDLPGYGYAKVPIAMKKKWDQHLAEYLQGRRSLKAVVLLMDIRHPLQDYDLQMIRWANDSELPIHLVLTKADKFNHGPAKAAQLAVERRLRGEGFQQFSVQIFSALKKTGIDELESFLTAHLVAEPQSADLD